MSGKARICHYCEQGKCKCKCKYRAGRKGLSSVTAYNTSRQSTLEEMMKDFKLFFDANPGPAVWQFSFTRIDPSRGSK